MIVKMTRDVFNNTGRSEEAMPCEVKVTEQ
jgi:hypothetical protein